MLNDNIKTLRTAKGMTQSELAEKLNVVRQTVSKWEKGLSVPDAGMLIKLASALGTTTETLLGEVIPEAQAYSVSALAAKLDDINSELARRSLRSRMVWRIIFIAAAAAAAAVSAKLILLHIHMRRADEFIGGSAGIIGGADGPTAITVTSAGGETAALLFTLLIFAASVFGIYKTFRR